MKRILRILYVSVLSGISMTAVSAPTAPSFIWGNLLTGRPGQDQCLGIAVDGNNSVYFMATDGSVDGDRDVTYAGELLYEGAVYSGTSANKNLTVLKTDSLGKKQWVIYSDSGDFISNEGGLAVGPSGNPVIFSAVRHTDGKAESGIHLVDAGGKKTDISWEPLTKRNIRLFLATASPAGEILWARTFECSTSPAPAATGSNVDFTSNAVNASDCAIDDDGNIYICGRYRNPLTFTRKDGTVVTLVPKNTVGWNGDSQKACGDLFLVKLDPEGNYMGHLAETGKPVDITYAWDIECYGTSVYLAGYSKADEDTEFSLGGITVKANAYASPIVAKLKGDLTPEWIVSLPGGPVTGKNTLQSLGISVSEKYVWLAGMYNGRVSDPKDSDRYVESTQGTLREGFIIKLDATRGTWLGGADSRSEFNQNYLTGYLRIVTEEQTNTDDILVYGYAMNAGIGAFVHSYDSTTLKGNPDRSWNLVSQGGVPTAQDLIYVPELATAYVTVRGNKAFQPFEGPLSEAVTGYTNYLARFDLPFERNSAGIPSAISEIDGEETTPVYYDLEGRKILTPTTPGLYIRRKGAKTEKILIKQQYRP